MRCGNAVTVPRRGAQPGTAAQQAARGEDGRALIEVLFLAVLLLIPTVYLLLGVLRAQSATLAAGQAARDVGRLLETVDLPPSMDDALAVAQVAFTDQQLPNAQVRLATAGVSEDCAAATTFEPTVQPGVDYQLCVIAVLELPGVPTALAGSRNSVTGVYRVHIDALREG